MVEERAFNPTLSLNPLYGPKTRSFSNASELEAWAEEEVRFWEPLIVLEAEVRSPGETKPRAIEDHRDHARSLVQAARNYANSADTSGAADSALNLIRGKFDMFRLGRLTCSDSDLARHVRRLADTNALLAAATLSAASQIGAPSDWYGEAHFNKRFSEAIKGWIELHMFERGISHTLDSALHQISEARSSIQPAVDRFRKFTDDAEKEWGEKIEGFMVKARLGAARSYWQERAAVHQNKVAPARQSWRNSTIGVLVALSALAALLFTELPRVITDTYYAYVLSMYLPHKPLRDGELIFQLVRNALMFASALGLGIWWLRQKLRDWRLHEHLSEDPSERVTMIDTYAALKGEGLSTADYSEILRALYRPGMAGMAEDGGPAVPVTILEKVVEKATQ